MPAHTRFIRLRANGRRRLSRAALLLASATVACERDESPLGVPTRSIGAVTLSVASAARNAIPGQYIVTLNGRADDAEGVASELVRQSNGTLRFTYRRAINGFTAKLSAQAVEALRHNPKVAAIEEDRLLVTSSDIQSRPPWALDRIDQPGLPLNGSFGLSNGGAGVNIYIVDTGIRTTHSEFGGRAVGAFTAVSDEYGTSDCHGHGTQVASMAGGWTYGVAKAARLHSVRVMDCAGIGEESAVIAALDWLVANRQLPAVANMSVSGDYSAAMNQAVANTVAAGIAVTVAAGNSSLDACQYSPASAAAAITTGASSAVDSRASFSNWGTCVDVFAPGTNVTAASALSDSAIAYASGTSMSAPLVAGAAALYLAANPTASASNVVAAIMNTTTTEILSNVGVGSPNRLLYVPASDWTAPTTPPPTDSTSQDKPPTAVFTSNCPRGRCTFDPGASTDDNGIVNYSWDFGDGSKFSSSSSSKVVHTYTLAATFSVTLTVTDAAGRSDRVVQVIKIRKA